MILLIDNYDSFVHNLARYFQRLGQETVVVRNHAIDVAGVRALQLKAIVLSPGPCTPQEAGVSVELVRSLWRDVPILGVCLGHQAIAAAFDAKIVAAPEPMHGRTSSISHDRTGVFADLPSPLTVCRYHSLVVDPTTLPSDFRITSRTDDGVVMAMQHRDAPLIGVQFHPEAILTEHGYALLANFLKLAGVESPGAPPLELPPVKPAPTVPDIPVTF